MIARLFIVTGRVQGVGFRYFTRDLAQKLGLTGWVANRYDGSVEIHAEGGAETLQRFLTLIRIGPAFADVEDVTARDVDVTKCTGFRITR
jgi:acylphosphatase